MLEPCWRTTDRHSASLVQNGHRSGAKRGKALYCRPMRTRANVASITFNLTLSFGLVGSACVSAGGSDLELGTVETCILVADLLVLEPVDHDLRLTAERIVADLLTPESSDDELMLSAERLVDEVAEPVRIIAAEGQDPESGKVNDAQATLAQWAQTSCGATSGDTPPAPDAAGSVSSEQATSSENPPDLQPALQLLADACENGLLDACDDLWLWSESGSDTELLALTCGGRSESEFPGSCSTTYDGPDGSLDRDPGEDSAALEFGSDPGFDVLYGACSGDDDEESEIRDAACELLYITAPTESAYEAEALSCGGRSERLVFQPCSELGEQEN